MRVFFSILITLLLSISLPISAQEIQSETEVICRGQINFDNGGDSVFVVVTCNDPYTTQERALAYARSMLDAIGFETFTAIRSATPFGPIGPVDADTSPNWVLVFFIPIKA